MGVERIKSIKVLPWHKFEIVDSRDLFIRIYEYLDNNEDATPQDLVDKFEISLYLAESIFSWFDI